MNGDDSAGRVPGLALPETPARSAPGVLKAILQPEDYWPAEILRKEVVAITARDKQILHVMEPGLVARILGDNGSSFGKHWIYRKIAGGESGTNSMIATENQTGWDAKTVLGPVLNPRNSLRHVPMIQDVANRRSNELATQSGTANISALMAAITLEVVWRLMFAPDDREFPLPAFVHEMIDQIYWSHLAGDQRRVADLIRTTADSSIEMATNCPHLTSSPFISGENNPLPQEVLRDNIRLFLSAGHKTSAAAISWTLWLLARDGKARTAVMAELDRIDPGNPNDFRNTPVTLAALHEAMRLFPPAIITARLAKQDLRLGSLDVPAGTPVIVNFYAMHRHRNLWPDADIFRSERFLPPNDQQVMPGSFRPFSAGRHVCLGMRFAELESVVILSELLRNFQFTPANTDPKPVYSFTLHAWDGVVLTVQNRP